MEELLNLQNKLNITLIGEDWKSKIKPIQIYTACHQEVSEFIDCFPWKWWKYQEVDLDNAKIEIVDILHFLLSAALYDEEAQEILIDIDYNMFKPEETYEENYSKIIEEILGFDNLFFRYIHYFPEHNRILFTMLVSSFYRVSNIFLTYDELVKLYYAKNILNFIRAEGGYKEGEYEKIKNNIEDNRYLFNLIHLITDASSFKEFETQLRKHLGINS